MFLKLGFFVLFICVLSQHTFVDANDHTIPGNFLRRIGDWQHARGDAWDRNAHIWHIFDKSDEPRETKIGSLKHAFGDKTYRFADKVDSLTLLLKEMFGQVVRDLKTKRQKNPEPEPTAPTEDPYLPTTSVSTGLTENVQPPDIDSMFNPEEIPFPPGFNPAPPPTSDPSPPKPNPTTPTGGPYFPISLGTTVKGDLPATTSSIGKLVLIDSEGKSTDLTPKQVVSVGKYFDNLLNGSN